MTSIGAWLIDNQDLDRFEAELLMTQVTGFGRAQILSQPDRKVEPVQLSQLNELAAQLRRGKPYAYIVGEQEFWSLPFHVSPAVLIPRPETELLVELVLEHASEGANILELGTGSGAIAVSLAHARPDLHLTATDISTDALDVAERNSRRHGTQIQFVHSNWFESLNGRWDIIVSNPPYIAEGDPHLPALSWEPTGALVAGDGLGAFQKIVATCPTHMREHGRLFLEHGYAQASQVKMLLQQHGFTACESYPDLAGILRVSAGLWSTK